MNYEEKQAILKKASKFFEDTIVKNHLKNTKKLKKLDNFIVNPFLVKYLANFLTGSGDAKSLAQALIYPRVLGTSINTSFGSNLQKFCTTILSGYASTTSGIDIEFIDAIDGQKKYCQIKAGPNTINHDDVNTIDNHFTAIKRLARTNNLRISTDDLVVGVLYGTTEELSSHYKSLETNYPILVGQDFWYRLTGDEDFYFNLIDEIASTAINADGRELLEETISKLACEIENSDIFFDQD